MYVLCIFLGINPRVTLSHDFIIHCTTWWQLGLNSKEDICVAQSQSLVRDWQGRPSQTPSAAIGATLSSCRNKCAWQRRTIAVQREVQQEAVAL